MTKTNCTMTSRGYKTAARQQGARSDKPTRTQPSLEEGEYLLALQIADYKQKHGVCKVEDKDGRKREAVPRKERSVVVVKPIVTTQAERGAVPAPLATAKSTTWDARSPMTVWWGRNTCSTPDNEGFAGDADYNVAMTLKTLTRALGATTLTFESDLEVSCQSAARFEDDGETIVSRPPAVPPKAKVEDLRAPRHPLAVHPNPKNLYSLKLPARITIPRLPPHTVDARLPQPTRSPHLKYRQRRMREVPEVEPTASTRLTRRSGVQDRPGMSRLRRQAAHARRLTVTIPEPRDKFRRMLAIPESAAV